MIYLDHNATTPPDEEVISAMMPYFREFYGNASSRTHLFGWDAREAIDLARQQLASLLRVKPRELVFTSGATEAVNLALRGLFPPDDSKGARLLTLKTEHKAVLDTCLWLEKHQGVHIDYLETDAHGHISLQHLAKAIKPQTRLVAIMFANNETGLIHPVREIAEICRQAETTFFCDATQAVGKIEVHPQTLGIDMLACSAHKMYGPKGAGALYLRKDLMLTPQITGGGQERKRRAGTLNVPAIVGFGKAAELAAKRHDKDQIKTEKLRDLLEKILFESLPGISVNGCTKHRLPHVSNLRFEGIESEDLMLALSTKVAVSSGSACNSAEVLPSHVLLAMGLSEEEALSSIRFSLGRHTGEEDIRHACELLIQTVKRLRS